MNIAFTLLDNMLSTSLTWPSEMWASAEQQARTAVFKKGSLQNLAAKQKRVKTRLVSCEKQTIKTHGGLTLTADIILKNNKQKGEVFDLIYVPALWRNPAKVIRDSKEIIQWLKYQYENGAILCGVGTGCCLLAETRLLDHKPATTHWYYFDQFEENYPHVQLKRQHFITDAGLIYCAASINSLADLTIHFIQRNYGTSIAQHMERHYSHEIRRDFERTSFVDQQNINHPDESILQAQLWMQDNLSDDINIESLAEQFGMSERNFNRRFKAATDNSPSQYLQNIRINTAQDLLQYSNLNITEVAERSGFNNLSYFAKKFKQHRSVSPREYRKTVRAKLFSQQT